MDTASQLNKTPVIFLAFANDRMNHTKYLRNLPNELRGIREALNKAKEAGLCELVERANATIEEILDVFQDKAYKDRIAVFHYGGHADCYRLILESSTGRGSPALKKGLASFLAGQNGLKLIFLNGCSTQEHALELIQNGIPAVIATSQLVHDDTAYKLAIRFYSGLANGTPLGRAWREAEDYIKMQKGTTNFKLFYKYGTEPDDRFPWDIFYKQGAKIIKEWNLPDAINDALFGLPPIPRTYNLPDKPYLFLKGYQRKHAEIFFGRSRYIRDLVNRVTDRNSAPIILLYGQSGVGKSSLLEAGIMPRLEETHTISYLKRDEENGLLGGVSKTLGKLFSSLNTKSVPPQATIEEKWKAIEAQTDKPLVVIADQVEGVYMYPGKRRPAEVEIFFDALSPLFSDPEAYPQGKLILGYRKEVHPEIAENFERFEMDYSTMFLQLLDENDIVEVVNGLTCSQRLRDKYNLTVEKKLPGLIAANLLEDWISPVAPTLQILLTKMWDQARQDRQSFNPNPLFSIKQYQRLRRDGLLMDDFFKQQIQKLSLINKKAVESGLALDLLKLHTTPLTTACCIKEEDIRKAYSHCVPDVLSLLKQLKQLYLLTDIQHDHQQSSLAHDTLAPVVIKAYNDSQLPGQRAARILASKTGDPASRDHKTALDEDDLKLVEKGEEGMKELTASEKEIVKEGQMRRRLRQKQKNRYRIALVALTFSIIFFTIYASWQWKVSLDREIIDEANFIASQAQLTEESNPTIAFALAKKAWKNVKTGIPYTTIHKVYSENNFYKIIAEREFAITSLAVSSDGKILIAGPSGKNACLLDPNGKEIITLHGNGSPVRSVGISPDGKNFRISFNNNSTWIFDREGKTINDFKLPDDWLTPVSFSPDGRYTLAGSVDNTAWLYNLKHKEKKVLTGHKSTVVSVAFSIDGNTILTGSIDGTARLWSLNGKQDAVFRGHESTVTSVAFSPNGKTILTGSHDKTARLWDYNGNELQTFRAHGSKINAVAFSPNGKYILTCSEDKTARLWTLKGEVIAILKGHAAGVTACAFLPGGRKIITASQDGKLRIWGWKDRELLDLKKVHCVAFSTDGNHIITGSEDGTVCLWTLKGKQVRVLKNRDGDDESTDDGVSTVAASQNNRYILSGSEKGTIRLWDMEGKELWKVKAAHRGVVFSACFSPDGQFILTGATDKTARLWDLDGKPLKEPARHPHRITSAAFSPDGTHILTGSFDGIVRLWDLEGNEKKVFGNLKNRIASVAFSPDGQLLIIAGTFKNYALLWDLKQSTLKQIIRHEAIVRSVAFSPDGRFVLTGSEDKIVRLWDLNGTQIRLFKGHDGLISSVAFSADGKYVLSGSFDNTARLWSTTPLENFLKTGLYEELNEEQLKEYGIDN